LAVLFKKNFISFFFFDRVYDFYDLSAASTSAVAGESLLLFKWGGRRREEEGKEEDIERGAGDSNEGSTRRRRKIKRPHTRIRIYTCECGKYISRRRSFK
jgi:hypothetical protein